MVFCNIIGTLDHGDRELMGKITKRLSPYKQDPHLGKLLNLLQSLERLCEPLFEGPGSTSECAPSPQRDLSAHFVPMSDHPSNPFGDDIEPILGAEDDPSADWLMWQLFNSQVPSGWLNKDFDSIGT